MSPQTNLKAWFKYAETPAELDTVFRLRHQVFCIEKGYAELQPTHRLLDHFDIFPTTKNIIVVDGEDILGGVRVMGENAFGFPSDAHFDFFPYLPPNARCAHGSMFFVAPGCRGCGLAPGLMQAAHLWSLEHQYSHLLALVAPMAEPLFHTFGYDVLSPHIPYPGAEGKALPVALDLERWFSRTLPSPRSQAKRSHLWC